MTHYFIDFHTESLVDSKDAYICYELQQTGLGERFLEELRKKLKLFLKRLK